MNFIENFHGRTTFISNSVIAELLRAQSIVIRIKTIKANPKISIIINMKDIRIKKEPAVDFAPLTIVKQSLENAKTDNVLYHAVDQRLSP